MRYDKQVENVSAALQTLHRFAINHSNDSALSVSVMRLAVQFYELLGDNFNTSELGGDFYFELIEQSRLDKK